jgi:hypothetical protein
LNDPDVAVIVPRVCGITYECTEHELTVPLFRVIVVARRPHTGWSAEGLAITQDTVESPTAGVSISLTI